jgi:hypothetical protein
MRLFLLAAFFLGHATVASALDKAAPAFEVTVTLSAAAEQKLSRAGETITIACYYGAEPKSGVATDDGQVPLADQNIELPGAGTAQIPAVSFPKSELKKVVGEARLNINVFISRKKFENNLLECGLFDDVLAAIPKDRPIDIACKLIGE